MTIIVIGDIIRAIPKRRGKMKLSIIICVYNTDTALVDSALSSIYSEVGAEEFEVIFVDDGSSTDYSEIINKYPIVYTKIENRGHLGARLHGISVAAGDYIAFVDSDDTVSKNYHAPMLAEAEKSHADIIINGWAFHTAKNKRICTRDTTMSMPLEARGDRALQLFAAQRGLEHSYYVLWNKIYRKELFLRSADELTAILGKEEKITYGEDVLLNFFCFKNASYVKNLNSGLYFYRMHSGQSVTVTDKDKLASQIDCMAKIFKIMLESIGENAYAEGIGRDIDEWRALVSRAQYATARTRKYTELYPVIKKSLSVERLELPRALDMTFYTGAELLGSNFDDIDSALTELYYAKKPVRVRYEKKSVYASRILEYARDVSGEIISSTEPDITVPKRKTKIIDRLIHSPFVYRLGLILFKKGSRARAFLKRHL